MLPLPAFETGVVTTKYELGSARTPPHEDRISSPAVSSLKEFPVMTPPPPLLVQTMACLVVGPELRTLAGEYISGYRKS